MADLAGILFLGFGILDGYRKGLVKKGLSLAITLATLFMVYVVSPYVADFIEGILPQALSIENLAGTDSEVYKILILSGFGEEADAYVRMFVARLLAMTVTYIVVKVILRTVLLSLELLVKVPGLRLVNRLLGAGFGLAQQVLTLWVFFLVLLIFEGTGWGAAATQWIRQGILLEYLYENNLLLLAGVLLVMS